MTDQQAAALELLRHIVKTMRAVMPYAENEANALEEMAHDDSTDADLQRKAQDAHLAVIRATALLHAIDVAVNNV